MANNHAHEALRESYERLHAASLALGGFAALLAGNTSIIDNDGLYYLLHPIEQEVATAVATLQIAVKTPE